jgi:hypothetical protein
MLIELSEQDISRLLSALEHYEAYLCSQKREDSAYYRDLVERLQQIKKPPASVTRPSEKIKSR